MHRMSRRTLVGGAVLLPVAGLTWRGVTATRQETSPEASPSASPSASPAASPVADGAIIVEAIDIEYSVTEIKVPADTDTTITLVNKGVLEHDLVIESLKLATALLKPGEEGSIVVNAPAGEYEYWCTVAGHKELGMLGKLIAE
jgi:nitrite reductase (NO-forming)